MQAEIAVLRFGLGARPEDLNEAASDPRAWLRSQIQGAVTLSSGTALSPSPRIYEAFIAARDEQLKMRRQAAAQGLAEETPRAQPAFNAVREAWLPHYRAQVLARAQSAATTQRPFAERLVHFWCNHFAVSADKFAVNGLAGALENEAIRPHVNGRFAELLTAVERHPAMIAYLDNQNSTGADSEAAQFARRPAGWRRPAEGRQPRQLGINENLAREILELHTLGVNGGYTQTDVTTFAKIITGWSIGGGKGRFAGGAPGEFYFRQGLHEPGPKTFLGKSYRESGEHQGEAVLWDLAHHPSTAHFVATKLARHFISDDPPAAAVERIAKVFLKSGGDLPQVYAALIDSPEAWDPEARKFKTPEDFVFSTLRSLNVSPQQPEEVLHSFDLLGQRPYTPGSPAGWPDTANSWDGADALMRRVLWASRMAAKFERGADPSAVVATSLGSYARPETLTAVNRAASSSQALALVLMSPEFQRR
jgi:uncharacterized protein (DUF1800 family)